MVWCGTANPSVLTFNRMWAIQRELAVMNVLLGKTSGVWGHGDSVTGSESNAIL